MTDPIPTAQRSDEDPGVPLSQRIRERLQAARVRFHANDNIADFIEPEEVPLLQAEVEEKLLEVLRSLVIDTDSDHNTQETRAGWRRCTCARFAAATSGCRRSRSSRTWRA